MFNLITPPCFQKLVPAESSLQCSHCEATIREPELKDCPPVLGWKLSIPAYVKHVTQTAVWSSFPNENNEAEQKKAAL